jgi:hypothetical protein
VVKCSVCGEEAADVSLHIRSAHMDYQHRRWWQVSLGTALGAFLGGAPGGAMIGCGFLRDDMSWRAPLWGVGFIFAAIGLFMGAGLYMEKVVSDRYGDRTPRFF